MHVQFAFIREGSSDDGLVAHLTELLVRAGCDSAFGASRDYKGSVLACLEALTREEADVDVVFVHRDSDASSGRGVRHEIERAAEALEDLSVNVVPVVPVQEMEAWLLLDSTEIRRVVGRPTGRQPLDLPKPAHVETVTSPKEVLAQALLRASGTTGRRLKDERRQFGARRRALLERLDIDGPVRQLPAWQLLESDVESVVLTLRSTARRRD